MFGTYPFSRTTLSGLPSGIFTATVTEDVSVAEHYLAGKVFTASVSENFDLLDPTTATAQFAASVAEGLSLDDVRIVGSAYILSISENASFLDILSATAQFPALVSEGVVLDDQRSITAGFSGIVFEDIQSNDASTQLTTYNVSRTEDSALADVRNVVAAFSSSITENIDPASVELASAQFAQAVTENFYPAWSSVEGEAYYASLVENFSLLAPATVSLGYLVFQDEDLTANDTPTVTAQFSALVSEPLLVFDNNVVLVNYLVSINENTGETDYANITASFSAQIIESIELLDTPSYFHYPVSVGWTPIDTNIYNYSANTLMLGAAALSQIPFSGNTGDEASAGVNVVTPNWEVGSTCAYETVPVYTYAPISPEGAIFGGGTFAGYTFGGFSGTYATLVTYERIGPLNTDVVWDGVNTDIYTTENVAVAVFGGSPLSVVSVSGYDSPTEIVTPIWEGGSVCAFETVPVYIYAPIDPEGAIFGSGTFSGFTFGGFSGTYETLTTYKRVGPTNTPVVWDTINNDIYTTISTTVSVFGGVPISSIAISSSTGGTVVVTPNWKDIENS